jgi:L-alanine-DL-glutamate epimerase-like enolase superfamily enzyme
MRIVDIKETVVPIASEIRNAYIDFSHMTVSVVALITDVVRNGKPVVGFGFNSNGRYAPAGLLRERFLPRLKAAKPDELVNDAGDNLDPFRIWDVLMKNEKPGGHGERSVAVGVIDMAVWDAVAKIADVPLYKLLAQRAGREPDRKVWVYAAGGYYYPGKDIEALRAEMQSYVDMGYAFVKIKIGGAPLVEDLRRIDAICDLVHDPGHLAVDANGRFDLAKAIEYGHALEPYGLLWYEEAGDPLDFALQKELSRYYPGAIATGENLFSMQDARTLLRYGGLHPERDFLQFDCALSYGLVEYLRTTKMLKENGWSLRRCVPHGGHQLSLNIAAGLGLGGNESYPTVFKPFNGFADNIPVQESYVTLPDVPGIGFELKNELFGVMKTLID